MNTRSRGLALAGGTAAISGVAVYVNSSGVAAYAAAGHGAATYTTAKNVAAAAIIALAFAMVRRTRGAAAASITPPSTTAQRWGLAFVAVLGGAVAFVLFFEGLARTASLQAAVLHKTLVIWVALLAVAFLKERLTWWHGGAIALLVLAQWGLAGDVALVADPGLALIAAATGLWAVETVIAKRLLRDVTPWTVSLTRMGGGAVALLGWAALTGGLGAVVPATAAQVAWVAVTGALLAGYVLTWHQALARAGAIDVTAVLVLGALVTAALAGAVDPAALAAQAPWLAMLASGGLLLYLSPRRAAS